MSPSNGTEFQVCPKYSTVNGGCQVLIARGDSNADCAVRFGNGQCAAGYQAELRGTENTMYPGLLGTIWTPYVLIPEMNT